MKDAIEKLRIHPHTTAAHIGGMCDALSNEHGAVCVKIYSINGEMRFKFERDVVDQDVPSFLRRQAT